MVGRAFWMTLALVSLALAGCAGDDAPPVEAIDDDDPFTDQDDAGAVRDLRTDLTQEDSLGAPAWEVGDWFGHHVFFGSADTSGSHINTIVVEDRGSEWFLATDDEGVARWEAAWDFPMVGTLSKSDISTSAFGADWNLYDFPITHGKSWNSDFDPLFSGTRTLTMTATYSDAIKTPYGIRPGFLIEGVNEDGLVELQTDYVPEIGWYNELTYFDTSTEDPDDFILHIISMGVGDDWTGTYYIDEAEALLDPTFTYFTPLDPTGSAIPVLEQFDVAGDGVELYGLVVTVASTGHQEFRLISPDNQQYEYGVTDTAVDPTFTTGTVNFEFISLSPVEGTWRLVRPGLGAFTGSQIFFWEIFQNEFQM